MTRQLSILLVAMAWSGLAIAQSPTVEAMMGDKNYWYQHSLGLNLTDSPFGFFHTSSLHLMYNEKEKNEVMSQSYITYRLAPFAKLAAGTFYASKPGISPSLAVQFKFQHEYLRALIVPRIDLKDNGSVEAMTMFEYLPPINEQVTFYSRAQLMSNYGPYHHNRSYQNFRIGIRAQKTTFGFALNIDERGPEKETLHNWGAFLRHDF